MTDDTTGSTHTGSTETHAGHGDALATASRGVADDLVLTLFDPRSGTIAGEGTLFYVLGGAVVADLSLGDHISAARGALGGMVVAATGAGPDDALLRDAWEYVREKPRGVQSVLAAIGPHLREPVLDRLVGRGDLHRTRGRVLGLIPTERLELGATGRREEVIGRLRATLVDGDEPDARTAALAALLSASGSLPTLDHEIPWSTPVIARAKGLERGDWGAAAAAAAVTRTMTALVVNTVIAANVVAARS